MAFTIGFAAESAQKTSDAAVQPISPPPRPRRSVVEVMFSQRKMKLSYYNDSFDLHCGDRVYVGGKLAGLQGRVTQVNYNFKIKVSDYQKILAVADTAVHGRFVQAGSHFVTFDPAALPYGKVLGWFKAPAQEDEVVKGSDGGEFPLCDLAAMKISAAAAELGHEYYADNRVRYLCLEGEQGRAIVEGSESYEVEFTVQEGMIRDLVCSCYCPGRCKHQFAAMLQLRETLGLLEKQHPGWEKSGYLAAVSKGTLFAYAIDGKETGSLVL